MNAVCQKRVDNSRKSFHDLSICRYAKAITAIYICSFTQESGCMESPRSPYFKQEWFVRILLPEFLQTENAWKKLFFSNI
jgi:hypothetical protein